MNGELDIGIVIHHAFMCKKSTLRSSASPAIGRGTGRGPSKLGESGDRGGRPAGPVACRRAGRSGGARRGSSNPGEPGDRGSRPAGPVEARRSGGTPGGACQSPASSAIGEGARRVSSKSGDWGGRGPSKLGEPGDRGGAQGGAH